MDNLTHSLIGAAVAEVVYQKCKQRDRGVTRAPLFAASVLANNLPDADLLLQIFEPGSLAYMLNHRGFTHTFFAVLPEAALTLVFLKALTALRRWTWSRLTWAAVTALTLLGIVLHIAVDALNSYGVHPFFPFDNSWYYGDSVFIIEPWFWVFLLPAAVLNLPKRWAHGGWIVLIFSPLLLGLPMHLTTWPFLALWLGSAFSALWLLRRCSEMARAKLALAGFALVIAAFTTMSAITRAAMARAFDRTQGFSLLDIALSPLPGNPLCWQFLSIERSETDYRARAGTFRYANDCPPAHAPTGARLGAVDKPSFAADARASEEGEYRVSLDFLFAELGHCRVREWLQFARVPYRSETVYNDLRFALRARRNFTTYDSRDHELGDCLPIEVPWHPPRVDLLKKVY